jgi:hypothetical protein
MTDGFRRACLMAAVVIGCAYSAFQILHDVRVPVQLLPGVAARVNGHQIDVDSVNRTVAGMDTRMRGPEPAARHDVLSRMIDEELLVQHALDSGAAETNPEVRAALVRSAITRVNSEAAAEPVSERELSEYFAAHQEVYATAASFDVTPVYFEERRRDRAGRGAGAAASGSDARDVLAGDASGGHTASGGAGAWPRAVAARAAIDAGASVQQAAVAADPLPFSAPGQHVSLRTLANYFGPALADAVNRLAAGHTTEIAQLGNGVVFFYLNNKTPGEVPSLASIHDLVAADALRERQDHVLEALLGSLRQSAHIEFATAPNPAPPVAASR